jgi:hypothetical protein
MDARHITMPLIPHSRAASCVSEFHLPNGGLSSVGAVPYC